MDGTCQICHKPADIKTWPDGNYCWDHYDARNKARDDFKSHDLSVANEGTEEHDHTSAN